MAAAARRSSGNTTLIVSGMTAEIGLFATRADPARELRFETAGPNGRPLHYREAAAPKEQPEPAPAAVQQDSDPLAALDEVQPPATPAAAPSSAQGEYRRILVEEGSDEEVKPEDVRRGIYLEDGRFIDCTDQLAAIEKRTKLDRIDVVACIDSTTVRRERVLGSFYLGAQDDASAPVLRVLYEALRLRREIAVVKYTVRSRQQLGVIVPHARTGTLVLLALAWSADVREAPAKATMIQSVEVKQRHVEAMATLLERVHSTVESLDELSDDALRLREELHALAVSGEMNALVEPLPEPQELPGLEDALAQALAAAQAA